MEISMEFNMISDTFSHVNSSTLGKIPTYFGWDFKTKDNDISFYIDGDIGKGFDDKNDGKRKFLWGLESRHFNSNFFNLVKNNLDTIFETYDMIFTYNDELCELDERIKWVPAMGYWINNPRLYTKSKLISMITSRKTMTEQQTFRVNFADSNKHKLDLFGNGYQPIPEKEYGLTKYMFSVCIENDTYDTYFTEKILDCFASATIPIYKGTKNITKYFNPDGIIFLDDCNIDELTPELYYSKLDAVKDNLNRVLEFNSIEDWFYNKYLKEVI